MAYPKKQSKWGIKDKNPPSGRSWWENSGKNVTFRPFLHLIDERGEARTLNQWLKRPLLYH